MPEIPFWFPFFTLFAGWFLKVLSDKWEHSRTVQRERELRASLRRAQLADQRTAFQRQTILALQEALQRLTRTTAQIHHADVMANHGRQVWKFGPVPEEADEPNRVAFADVLMLTARIRDQRVRELVGNLTLVCTRVQFAESRAESDRLLSDAQTAYYAVTDRIGEVLRNIEVIEDSAG